LPERQQCRRKKITGSATRNAPRRRGPTNLLETEIANPSEKSHGRNELAPTTILTAGRREGSLWKGRHLYGPCKIAWIRRNEATPNRCLRSPNGVLRDWRLTKVCMRQQGLREASRIAAPPHSRMPLLIRAELEALRPQGMLRDRMQASL